MSQQQSAPMSFNQSAIQDQPMEATPATQGYEIAVPNAGGDPSGLSPSKEDLKQQLQVLQDTLRESERSAL